VPEILLDSVVSVVDQFVRSASGVRSWQDLLSRSDVISGASAPGAAGTADIAMLRNLFGARIKQVQGYAGSAAKRLAIDKGEIDGECGRFTSMPDDWLARQQGRHPPSIAAHGRGHWRVDRRRKARLDRARERAPSLRFPCGAGEAWRLFMVSGRVPADRVAACVQRSMPRSRLPQ